MNDITFAGYCDRFEKNVKSNRLIVIAAQSDGKIIFNGGEIDFAKGEIIAVPPLFMHSLQCEGGLCAHIERAIVPLTQVAVFSDDGDIAHAIIQAEKHSCDGAIKKALGELIAAYVNSKTRRKNYSPVTVALQSEIEAHVSDCFYNLEDSLKKLPLNYDYIRKLFQKETGATPHAYLTSLRMKLAAQIIESGVSNKYSKYTVSQIAEACGFNEPLYFSRVFKKYYGCCPKEYAEIYSKI